MIEKLFSAQMYRILLLVFLSIFWLHNGYTQSSFVINSFNETANAFKYLLLTNETIAGNDTVNEGILDLVEPMVLDSVLKRKRQHHRLFLVGWSIHAFAGYNWRAVNMTKQKLVGTVQRFGHSSKIDFTEYDVNFHLQFHLPKYFDLVCRSFDMQRKIRKQDINPSHKTNYKAEPYIRSDTARNTALYHLETELTPPHAFIAPLHYLFYPTLPGMGGLQEHPNFETRHPSMGFYGVNCLDCNHNCHPEIHPYEWVWWLKTADGDTSKRRIWMIGLLKDGSNRFKKWGANPKTGIIKIPFLMIVDDSSKIHRILIDHLVFNNFDNEAFKSLQVPDGNFGTSELLEQVNFVHEDSTVLRAEIIFNQVLKTDALKYWFTNLNYDKPNKRLSGFFHFAVSARDLYTTRITFEE